MFKLSVTDHFQLPNQERRHPLIREGVPLTSRACCSGLVDPFKSYQQGLSVAGSWWVDKKETELTM